MLDENRLIRKLREDPEMVTYPFNAIKHLITDDYRMYFLELNLLFTGSQFYERNGIFYFRRGMIKDLLKLEWEREATLREQNSVVFGITSLNIGLRQIDSDIFLPIRFVEDDEWERMKFV